MVDWDEPEFAALAAKYGDDVVLAALRIQQHIETHGIDGLHFKQRGERRLERVLPMVTNRKCTKQMRAELRKARRRS